MTVSVVPVVMPETECQNLLFDLLKCEFVIITHTEELFNSLVRCCRNVYRTVVVLGETFTYDLSITLICLDPFPAALLKHCCRCEDYARYFMSCQLVIQGVA